MFGETRRLGGAPLNFAAHAASLGHPVSLISGLGTDALGDEAAEQLEALGLDASLVQRIPAYATGKAIVELGPGGAPAFLIARPAAWERLAMTAAETDRICRQAPEWIYFGSLMAASDEGLHALQTLLHELGSTMRFLDLNLRPGSDSPALIQELLAVADVVKLNEDEVRVVSGVAGLPTATETFCRAASSRFELDGIAVTLGERGCALLVGDEYIEVPGVPVVVADTVGAGDAFAAAWFHGLTREWPLAEIGAFANRLAAGVARRHGSLPE
jgi:fructokinase